MIEPVTFLLCPSCGKFHHSRNPNQYLRRRDVERQLAECAATNKAIYDADTDPLQATEII